MSVKNEAQEEWTVTQINEVAGLEVESGIAVLTIDSPPVNALSVAVRRGLLDGMEQAIADDAVSAIVIRCAGRTFFAGFDISEFDSGLKEPNLNAVLALVEQSAKPVIAALHGTALGGGFELALACDYRVATAATKVGLPEVNLGLLPGAGGTQRLPRIVGVEAALDMIVFGRPVIGGDALALGLVDHMVEDDAALRNGAVTFARSIVAEERALVKVRDREDRLEEARANPGLFDAFRRKHARALKGPKAPENIVKAIEAAVALPFAEGMKREAELFIELYASVESAAQRYIFFAQRAAGKVPGVSAATPVRPVKRVGVIGAGTMGGGIAMNFLNIGVPVMLVERAADALERGVGVIRRNYETTVRKGRLPAEALNQRMALLTPTIDFATLDDCDLVIEAVFEDLDLKKRVFVQLDAVAKPGAILASNTSFLDLDAIAAATGRPQDVIGLHFFSPANVMRLLEVVRGEKTDLEVVATAMQLGRRIDKTAVLSRVCDGFIANRAMAVRSEQANRLILEGPMPWDVDRTIADFGFPMGPFAMTDLVGLDVIGWNPETTSGASVLERLCEMGRWGQKRSGGYYDYDEQRRATPSEAAAAVIRDFAAGQGIVPRAFADQEIVERLLFPVVNEGAKILEEGVALRASDIDVALTTGYGWPVHTGGPMFWADSVGLAAIVARMDSLQADLGDAFAPCALLRRVAAGGGSLHAL